MFLLLIVFFGWLVRPDLTQPPAEYDRNQLDYVTALRNIDIDTNNPPVLYRQVDYSQGTAGTWYPRGQAPILDQLVKEGKLPPVDQRTGTEPAVVEGIDGIGKYGGTWYRITTQNVLPDEIVSRLSYVALVRWSPYGYPIVPHVAKSFQVSDDNREFVFHLRRGMRWSDGYPFTADDIMFWWEHIAKDSNIMADVPAIMKVRGKVGNIEKLDDYTIRITFPYPNGIFLARAASDGMSGQGEMYANMLSYPQHYLRKFHPTVGDKQLIERMLKETKFKSPVTFFRNILYDVQGYPDYPRLWPWVYRKYQSSPPYCLVRNPYYWMVDTNGNQLPYIDSMVFTHRSQEMVPIAAANGEVSMQFRFIPFGEYTHLMSQRKSNNYEVYHWYPGDRSEFLIACNLNYRVDAEDIASQNKHDLLNDRRFRQALSLAINRRAIIKAEYGGLAEPAQCAPGPASYFYEPALYNSYTNYNPQEAGRLLDEIGLGRRDYEGYRTFSDGSKMTFYLNVASSVGSAGIVQLVVDDWAKVGLRVIPKIKERRLFYVENMSLQLDLTVWIGNGEFLPVVSPRYFVPTENACNFAVGYARWFFKGGLYGDPRAQTLGCIAPPPDSDILKVMQLYNELCAFSEPTQQKEVLDRILKINAENLWTINVSTPPPVLVIVKDGFKNVPPKAVSCWEFKSPGNAGIETYYFDNPYSHPSAVDEVKDSILNVRMPPGSTANGQTNGASLSSGSFVRAFVKYIILCILVLFLVMAAVKHPFVARRLVILIPTLLVISVVIFLIIQAPPGDYLTSRIMMLQELGDAATQQEAKDLKEIFWLDKPVYVQYARWLGLYWFATFDDKDKGLLQGDLGKSMDRGRPVNDMVGDRIVLTVLIALGTILLTWAIALPIGIYSAVRQYSLSDYLFTFIGFIGMCIPSFLLALIGMYVGKVVFGVSVSGLFSSEYGAQPQWDWGKVADLLKHIWLPIVVLTVGGTAGMIRVMRGNLLDELRKPYVMTAKAKGLRPVRVLFKYPVRLALNPFVSSIGTLFPQLISGGAIVAIVLSLPTVGPLMLNALMMEDMYLAGSMLMVLSLLGVFGTLVSDLLLLWLDPRIRFRGGSR